MAKNTTIEVWMGVENFDCDGNAINCSELLIEGEFIPACKGSRGDYGLAIEPDSPAEVEFISATDNDGKEIHLCREDLKRAQVILNEAMPTAEDFEDDRY